MENLKKYIDYICQPHPYRREAAPDICHNLLLFSTIVSQKPERVLELGVGTSFTSHSILYALKYNGFGKLTSVDNMGNYDENLQEGNVTPKIIENIIDMGAEFVLSTEEDYVKNCPDNTFDLVMSDADHNRAHLWKEELFRLTKPNGILFFHDATNKGFKISEYVDYVRDNNIPHFLFDKNSRPDEHCAENGWLMVINKK